MAKRFVSTTGRHPSTSINRHNAAKFDMEDAAREYNISEADLLQVIYDVLHDLKYESDKLVNFIDDQYEGNEDALEVSTGIKVKEGY